MDTQTNEVLRTKKKVDRLDSDNALIYNVSEVPPIYLSLFFGFQVRNHSLFTKVVVDMCTLIFQGASYKFHEIYEVNIQTWQKILFKERVVEPLRPILIGSVLYVEGRRVSMIRIETIWQNWLLSDSLQKYKKQIRSLKHMVTKGRGLL